MERAGRSALTVSGWALLLTLARLTGINTLQCPPVDPRKHTLLLQHPNDCRQFLVCEHGTARLAHCPASLHFNPVLNVCDWPDKAQCHSSITPVTVTATAPPMRCSYRDPRTYTRFFPHPDHCHLFYRCDYGIARLESCSGGLHFNPQLQVCDWPNKAGCAGHRSTAAIN